MTSDVQEPSEILSRAAQFAFRDAAKRLKTAEVEYRAAQQAYMEAVKQLSEEATR